MQLAIRPPSHEGAQPRNMDHRVDPHGARELQMHSDRGGHSLDTEGASEEGLELVAA